jgi:hypothetical protein
MQRVFCSKFPAVLAYCGSCVEASARLTIESTGIASYHFVMGNFAIPRKRADAENAVGRSFDLAER